MLTKVRLDFGTEQSPTPVTLSQINAIFDTIHDEGVSTAYSGHISLATGSITDAQAFELGANGITYHGNITAVSYDVSASPISITEGGKVVITATNGVPASALQVEFAGITGVTGSITAQQLQSHLRIEGNDVYVDKVNTGNAWSATILLDVKAKFSLAEPKRISISVQGVVELTGVSLSGDAAVDILYPADYVDKTYTIVYQPSNFTTEVGMPNVVCSDTRAQVISTNRNSFTVRYTGSEAYSNTIRCTVGGFTAELAVGVTRTIIPEITIDGPAEFTAKNGDGTADYSFVLTPNNYNVEVSLISVVSSNADVKVGSKSLSGFKLSTTGITAGLGTTITATFNVNGASKSITKHVDVKYEESYELEAVDLGLPSGTKWANMNVGADTPWGYGKYFMWGEVEGNDCADGTTGGRVYDQAAYNALGLNTISANLDLAHDAANHHMGGSWHMPTKEQYQELYDNTTSQWTMMGGVYGRKFISKIDSSKWIFIPAAGYCYSSSLNDRGSGVRCWSASFDSSSYAYYLRASSSSVLPQYGSYRYNGISVRGVL